MHWAFGMDRTSPVLDKFTISGDTAKAFIAQCNKCFYEVSAEIYASKHVLPCDLGPHNSAGFRRRCKGLSPEACMYKGGRNNSNEKKQVC